MCGVVGAGREGRFPWNLVGPWIPKWIYCLALCVCVCARVCVHVCVCVKTKVLPKDCSKIWKYKYQNKNNMKQPVALLT